MCTFLAFCVSGLNVTDINVGLWDENDKIGIEGFKSTITCQINHEENESVHFEYPPYYRFQVCSLGAKTGSLFLTLNHKDTKPILKFLPKSKTDRLVDRNKIRELCTALEVEFDYQKALFPYDKLENLINELKHTVKEYRKAHANEIDDREYDYVFGSLSHISFRSKFCCYFADSMVSAGRLSSCQYAPEVRCILASCIVCSGRHSGSRYSHSCQSDRLIHSETGTRLSPTH